MASYLGKAPARLAIVTDDSVTSAKIVDNTVTSADILNATITGADLASDITISTTGTITTSQVNLGDNETAYFGTGNDLSIFHSGTASWIKDVNGTSNLILASDQDVQIRNSTGSQFKAKFITNGAVELYYDNSKKFETTSAGATITGNATVTGDLTVDTNTFFVDSTNNKVGILASSTPTRTFEIGGDGTNAGSFSVKAADGSEWFRVSNGEVAFNQQGGRTTVATGVDLGGRVNIGQLNNSRAALAVAGGYANNIIEVNSTNADSGGDVMVIDQNGNVGIGTTSPDTPLHIVSSGSNDMTLKVQQSSVTLSNTPYSAIVSQFMRQSESIIDIATSDNGYGEIWFTDATHQADARIRYEHTDRKLKFWTSGGEKMAIDSSGNVGIGTTSPSTLLHLSSADPQITITDTDGTGSQVIKASGDDLQIDVVGKTVIDSGNGGTLQLADDGTSFIKLFQFGTWTAIESMRSDYDFKIRGNDGGSYIDALTFDMSEAGAATFNDKIVLGANKAIEFGDPGESISGDGTDMTITGNIVKIDAVNRIILDAQDNRIDLADNGNEFARFLNNGGQLQIRTGSSAATAISFDSSGGATFGDKIVLGANKRLELGDAGEYIFGDGTNLIAASSGYINLSSTGNLLLNTSSSSSIFFRQNDVNHLQILKTSGNAVIKSSISDGDLLIKGNDGGSEVTALTFDMSEAGAATFNDKITLGASKNLVFGDPGEYIYGDGTNLQVVSSNALGIDTANGIILDSGSGGTTLKAGGGTIYGSLVNSSGDLIIKSGTTTALTFSGADVTAANDLTVTGNLIVSGTTTTVNTETINLADNTITLNSNETGTPSQDGGIEIERGTSTNKTLIWNETSDKWTVGSETFVAGTFEGALTGDVTGNADTATTLATARTIAGQSFDGSANITIASTDLSDTSSITLNTATQTLTNKTLGATTIAGHLIPDTNITYDLGSSTFRFRDLYLSGNSIELGSATITASGSSIVLPSGSTISGGNGDVADLNSSQTLTNKTLTSPAFSGTATNFQSTGIDDNATSTAITIDSSENVGIGTASPSTKLDVEGTGVPVEINSSNSNTYKIQFADNGTVRGYIGSSSSSPIRFANGSASELMRIASNGNVGIGVSSPKTFLHLLGDAPTYNFSAGTDTTANLALINDNGNAGTGASIVFGSTYSGVADVANARIFAERQSTGSTNAGASDLIFEVGNDTGSSLIERMRILDNGNVGIGTSSPNTNLDIRDTGANNGGTLTLGTTNDTTGGDYGAIQFYKADPSGAGAGVTASITATDGANSGANSDLVFATGDSGIANTERMRIDSSGNVGIGTSSPASKLNIYGNDFNGTTLKLTREGSHVYTGSVIFEKIKWDANDSIQGVVTGDRIMQIYSYGTNDTNGTLAPGPSIVSHVTSDATSGNDIEGNIQFRNGNDTVTFTSTHDGDIGIGTTTPASLLDLRKSLGSTLIIGAPGNNGSEVNTIEFRDRNTGSFANGQIGSFIKGVRQTTSFSHYLTFGTTDADADATEKVRITPAGSLLVNTTDDNSGKADFAVYTGGSPTLSFRSGSIDQVQIGSTDVNFNGRVYHDDTTFNFDGWNSHVKISSSSSSGASSRDIIFSPQATGGAATERLIIKGDTGNVGIGTSSPQDVLDVGNATLGRGIVWGGSAGTAHYSSIWSEYGTGSIVVGAGLKGSTSNSNFIYPFTGTYGYSAIELDSFSNDGIKFYTAADGARTSGTVATKQERMRVDTSGNVGIGTSSPGTALDVKSQINVTNSGNVSLQAVTGSRWGYSPSWRAVVLGGTGVGVNNTTAIGYDPSGNPSGAFSGDGRELLFRNGIQFTTPNSADNGFHHSLIVLKDGDVGIGESTPLGNLHVKGGDSATASVDALADELVVESSGSGGMTILTPASSTGNIFFGDPNNNTIGRIQYTHNGNAMLFTTNGSEAIRIDSSGNVGIGTTSPSYKLEVNGTFAATSKSFDIKHPTKDNMRLRYGSLEGPENGVYVRGRTKNKIINLPDYWIGLVHNDTITVSLTAVGKQQEIYVKDIVDNKVIIENNNDYIDCFYTIFAERKDIDKLTVEYGIN